MYAAVAANAGHPAVAALLGLGAAALAGAVVAMAWVVHARQIRLAEQLARRQFLVMTEPVRPEQHGAEVSGETAGPTAPGIRRATEYRHRPVVRGARAPGTGAARMGQPGKRAPSKRPPVIQARHSQVPGRPRRS